MRIPYQRVFGVWVLLAVLMSANGIFRELVLRNALGSEMAEYVSIALGLTVILLITRVFFRPLEVLSTAQLLGVGALYVVMTVAFEFLVGHFVDHKPWQELAAAYRFWRGELWPFVLLITGLTPMIWGRWFAPPPQSR
jgi:hypothetical protein